MASDKARTVPKNEEKCSFILNYIKQNASDDRPSRKFVLPKLEELRDCLLLSRRPEWHDVLTGLQQLCVPEFSCLCWCQVKGGENLLCCAVLCHW